MLAATKVKMRGREIKVNKNTYDIFSTKPATSKFLEVSRCSRPKITAKKCTKKVVKVCFTCKVAFLLIRPIVVFSPLVAAFAA